MSRTLGLNIATKVSICVLYTRFLRYEAEARLTVTASSGLCQETTSVGVQAVWKAVRKVSSINQKLSLEGMHCEEGVDLGKERPEMWKISSLCRRQ